MDGNMQEIFKRNQEGVFNDLKKQKLSANARLFLCEEINGCHNIEGPLTVYGASKRYNIPRTTVAGWYNIYRKGNCFHDGNGRPASLDAESMIVVNNKMTPSDRENMNNISDDLAFCIEQEKIATRKRRRQGIVSFPVCVDVLSDDTLRRIKRQLTVTDMMNDL